MRITRTQPLPKATAPPISFVARLEDGISLLGYALTDASSRSVQSIQPGQTLILDLYWQAGRKVSQDYTVFAHLAGQAYNPATAGPVWAGHDSPPLEGGYPTTQWFVEHTVRDRHLLTVHPQAPVGEYELEVGMYLLETMERLPVLEAEGQPQSDRIVLDHLPVTGG
jgi:hypothetical protein